MPASVHLQWSAIAAVLVAVVGWAAPGRAQTVRGRVVEAGVNAPIMDANLQLVDRGGHVLEQTRSDSAGWFALVQARPRKTELRLIARRIGFYAAMIELPSSTTDQRTDLLIAMRRLVLDTVRVASTKSRSLALGLHPNSLAFKPITRDVIERELASSRDLLDLLRRRQLPGVLVDKAGCVRIHMGYCALLIVDGMPQVWSMNLADVDEVLVLTVNEAQVLYGAQAAGGAIVVYTITGAPRK